MREETEKNLQLRRKVNDLAGNIVSEIGHGECFYNKVYFLEFMELVEELKGNSIAYFESNQKELERDAT